MPGENLDLSSDSPLENKGGPAKETPSKGTGDGAKAAAGKGGKRYLGIHFTCCDVYCRIYPNREGTAYQGYCPKCSKPVRIKVGAGGTDSRFFTVS